MTEKVHSLVVAMNYPHSAPRLIQFSRNVRERMTGSKWFPKAGPLLGKLDTVVTKLTDAEVKVALLKDVKTARDIAREVVVKALHRLREHVQQIADDNPEHAAEIIESSGFSVKKSNHPPKQPIVPRHLKRSGGVRITVRALGKTVLYIWEMSEDGGKTWIRLGTSRVAKWEVDGLTPGKKYWFRFSAQTPRGPVDWCQPVWIIAL